MIFYCFHILSYIFSYSRTINHFVLGQNYSLSHILHSLHTKLLLFLSLSLSLSIFWDRVSLHSPDWPGTWFVAQAGIKFAILAPTSRVPSSSLIHEYWL
jgi:hypothetical protein